MSAQDKFGDLVREHFAPLLKDRGFRRKDVTFRRPVDGSWQIVNFQRSRYSHARHVSFTVNLGVTHGALHRENAGWTSRGWPLEYECDFRARLGILADGQDRWWTVRPLLPVRPVAKAVLGRFEHDGLPWLELHSDGPRLLSQALAEPSAVSSMNLASLVSLAEAIGTPEQLRAAERQLAQWQGGGR